VRFTLVAADDREVVLEHEDRVLQRAHVGATPVAIRFPRLALDPGVNQFKLRSPQRPVRLGTGHYSLRTFGLKQAAIRVVAGGEPAR